MGGAHHLKKNSTVHCSLLACSDSKMNGAARRGLGEGGKKVQELREELDRRHQQAKSKQKGGAGGGVSLWPAMDDMRLSREEAWQLLGLCVLLMTCTCAAFYMYHGNQITKLKSYVAQLEDFPSLHSLSATSDQALLNQQVLMWHRDFLQLQQEIHEDFDVVWSETTVASNLILALYMGGICTLLYFLVDNMVSRSRLTPARIKVWVSLLCVVSVWTLLAVYLLTSALALETNTRTVVYSLNEALAVLVESSVQLDVYHSVLLYWRTRCLPPTSPGVLSVLGLLQVQDVAYYLQYYSLPILTAICTPIVKLILSLRTVYCL